MSFFPPDPVMPEPDDTSAPRTPWWTAPSDEIPVLHPVSRSLAATEHVAIALVGAAVYSDGVELRIERRLRRGDLPAGEWQELCGSFMENWHGGIRDSRGRLRYGLQLSTGEKATDALRFFGGGNPAMPPAGYSVVRAGGGGGGSSHSYASSDTLWVWPLPPAGPWDIVVQWPLLGIPETRTTLDDTDFAALASRAAPFWP